MSCATPVRRRTSGAATGTRTAADAVEQPIHLTAEGLPYIGKGGLRQGRLLHFNGYLCHRCLHRSVERKRVYPGYKHRRDIDLVQFIPPLHPIAVFASPGAPARWREILPPCVAVRQ